VCQRGRHGRDGGIRQRRFSQRGFRNGAFANGGYGSGASGITGVFRNG
jgi:hypothetical protein